MPLITHIFVAPFRAVIVPSIAGTPTAGETYSLNCSLTGMILADPATYQWFDSNGIQLSNTSCLWLSPLLASHAGTYTCQATVRGVVVENNKTVEVICKFLL